MLLANGGRTTVTCEMGYPENYYEHDVFPQSLVFVEGDKGTAEVASRLLDTCDDAATARTVQALSAGHATPGRDPDHRAVHASIVTLPRPPACGRCGARAGPRPRARTT